MLIICIFVIIITILASVPWKFQCLLDSNPRAGINVARGSGAAELTTSLCLVLQHPYWHPWASKNPRHLTAVEGILPTFNIEMLWTDP